QVTVNDSVQAPPPPPAGNLQAILDMPAGSWLAYGLPWSTLETSGELQSNRDDCGPNLSSIIGAWNGVAWDGRYLWNFAGGGHGDGCFNGIVRYDLETASPEVVAPHVPLNVPVCWGPFTKANGQQDCYYEPYASATPAPICSTTTDPNCGGFTLAEILAAGTNYPVADAQANEAPGSETFGAFLRPRSSHMYNNMIRLGDYIYLTTGQTYGGTKDDNQVWRFNVNDPANTIERLPNKTAGGYNTNVHDVPGHGPLFFGGGQVCTADYVAGVYDCQSYGGITISQGATAVWDDTENGLWVFDKNLNRLSFIQEVGGIWTTVESITDATVLSKSGLGNAGICLVPTDNGTNPVIWGENATLIRWDGTALSEVTGQVGQPATSSGAVLNKWTWNDDLGACLGSWSWNRGIDAWRPDFSNWEQASLPPPEPDPIPGDWPTFAGHVVRPAPFTPAAWDQPIERQPDAPDFAAVCPGHWVELHYSTPADAAGSAPQMRGLARSGNPNVRVYLHPLPDGEAYGSTIKFDEVTCAELVGVPENGVQPRMADRIAAGGAGVIVRGVDFQSGGVHWTNSPVFVVLHDNTIPGAGLMGDSDPNKPLTYLEFRGNFICNNADWHTFYGERSLGRLVALSNVFCGAGRGTHAFKNLAHQSRIEGNVFSNVGIDGQVIAQDSNGKDIIGLAPVDLYMCTESVFRNNTVIFRTSDAVRAFMLHRGRNAWNNCNKGQRLETGRWELWQPEDPDYANPDKWAEIHAALPAFDQGYAAALAQPWLFAHLNEGNTFIVFKHELCGGVPCTGTRAATVDSLRPLADNVQEAAIGAESRALALSCADAPDRTACFLAGAGEAILYAYDHIDPAKRPQVVNDGKWPNNVPIRHPEEWRERAGLFWGQQTYITCTADGADCAVTGDRIVDATPRSWDALEVASPPRLLPF
ncbi:MAG TPA: hypothetical protein VGB35_00045, partial [Gammaproteobacteria bacterium]